MDENGHLQRTFHLSRSPPHSHTPLLLQHQQPTLQSTTNDQMPLVLAQQCMNLPIQKKVRSMNNSHYHKIFKMITNKISPSTAVNTPSKLIPSSKTKRPTIDDFMASFEQFFRGFIQDGPQKLEIEDKSEENVDLKVKKPSKTSNRIRSLQTNRMENMDQDQDLFVETKLQKQRKMSYHQRLKQQIENQLYGIFKNTEQKKHQINLAHRPYNSNVQKELWLKTCMRRAQPKLRLSKTGLAIHLNDPEHRTVSHKRFLEREKAKKDHLFQKSLAKNNWVTLNSIENYQKNSKKPRQTQDVSSHLRISQSRCLKETVCSQNRRKINTKRMRKSCDDLSYFKLNEKCLQIQLDCHHSAQQYRDLGRGLKAFQGFSRVVEQKLELDAQIMSAATLTCSKNRKNSQNRSKGELREY